MNFKSPVMCREKALWGRASTPAEQNIVWAENCDRAHCDNIVWGHSGDDNRSRGRRP